MIHSNRNAVVVFAKVPDRQIAKSRIAATHGEQQAAAIYSELLEITAKLVDGVPYHVAFAGAGEPGKLSALFCGAESFFAQEGETLGERLHLAFQHLFDKGCASVTAIGCDCPLLTPERLAEAIDALAGGRDVALGPAEDGGYYLIGAKPHSLAVFDATGWGSPRLLEQTLSIIRKNNYTLHTLGTLYDIDYMEDYRRWKSGE